MEIRKPAYFDRFRCLAGACPDSCCHEWEVAVDETAAACYRALPGALGEDLRRVMYEEDGNTYFAIRADGRCPMWRQDGLCRIQAEQGEAALCRVCREFPRLTHDYGDFVERGLELSCPEAARLILESEAAPWITETAPGGAGEYDPQDMEVLLAARREAVALLEDPRFTVEEALALLLIHGSCAQARLDGAQDVTFSAADSLVFARELAREGDAEGLTDFFLSLELLTQRWPRLLRAGWRKKPMGPQVRRLARYFTERYYLQAISDFDLMSRVKFGVICCILVSGLEGDLLPVAQLCSKELENNAENVEAVLDGAYTHPALTDASLLGLLLK